MKENLTSSYVKNKVTEILLYINLLLTIDILDALGATIVNCKLNHLLDFDRLKLLSDNLLVQKGPILKNIDCVLIGDMFYDSDFTHLIVKWLTRLKNKVVPS